MPFFSIFVHYNSTIRKQIPLSAQMPIFIGIQGYLYYFNVDDIICCSCSVIKSYLTLPLHGLQHGGIPCPSPSSRVCSNSCPLSWWCYETTSSSVSPFSSCPQSFPATKSFPVSHLFVSDGQSTGASASASIFPKTIQDWFPLRLAVLISLQSKGPSGVFSSTRV